MKRIAILGAGPSALTAAWNLSEPGLAHQITLYQQGWRAGGLCASGRVGEQQWLNQNGTHYLFGCYASTLGLLKAAYGVLARHGDTRFGTFEEQLVPRDLLVIRQLYRGAWTDWVLPMPRRGGSVLDTTNLPEPHQAWGEITKQLFVWLRSDEVQTHLATPAKEPVRHLTDTLVARLRRFVEGVEERVEGAALDSVSGLLTEAERLLERFLSALVDGGHDELITLLADVLTALRDALRLVLEPLGALSVLAYRAALLCDIGLTVAIGGLRDHAFTPEGLAALDALDFRDWLLQHGARESSAWSAPISVWYDSVASYAGGSLATPRASTCATLIGFARLMSYPSSFAYQLSWEAGDSVIAPIVAALEHRGVRFEYFHRVWDIVPSQDGTRIERVELERQLELREGLHAYDPFEPSVAEEGRVVWPDEPRWDQIASPRPDGWVGGLAAELLHALPLDPAAAPRVRPGLESSYYPRSGPTVTLEAGRDFDVLLGAMGLAMYRCSAPSLLAATPALQGAIDSVGTTETQSLRLWLEPDLAGIGWTTQPPILSAYAPPFSTWEDPSECLASERWPAPAPQTVSHLFGALEARPGSDDPAHLQAQTTQAYLNASAWSMNNVGLLWPGVADRTQPLALDASFATAIQCRANVGLEQHYTQILPGTADKRLAPGRTQFGNFIVCGDWTRTSLLTACFEGAVESGLAAAAAV